MCRAVRCKTCQKTTWAGCGQHVAQVRRGVPAGQWCPGHQERAPASEPEATVRGGFLSRLLGR